MNKYTHSKQPYEDRIWAETRIQGAYRFKAGRINARRISNGEGTIGSQTTAERIWGTLANPGYRFGASLGVNFVGNTGKLLKNRRARSVQ